MSKMMKGGRRRDGNEAKFLIDGLSLFVLFTGTVYPGMILSLLL